MQRKIFRQYMVRVSSRQGPEDMRRLVLRRWRKLTERDLEDAGGDRSVLARIIAKRHRIHVGEAKRQLRDFLRVVAPGKAVGGKRARRAAERLEWASPEEGSPAAGTGTAGSGSLAGETGGVPERTGSTSERHSDSLARGGMAGEPGTDPIR